MALSNRKKLAQLLRTMLGDPAEDREAIAQELVGWSQRFALRAGCMEWDDEPKNRGGRPRPRGNSDSVDVDYMRLIVGQARELVADVRRRARRHRNPAVWRTSFVAERGPLGQIRPGPDDVEASFRAFLADVALDRSVLLGVAAARVVLWYLQDDSSPAAAERLVERLKKSGKSSA